VGGAPWGTEKRGGKKEKLRTPASTVKTIPLETVGRDSKYLFPSPQAGGGEGGGGRRRVVKQC